MKKFFLSFILVAGFAVTAPIAVQQAKADICVPSDPDFDAADCAANGGVVGTPIGIGGGPGGAGGVPIDGGLSIMLAVGGALGARKALRKKKANA
jgi:hypothetical protein